MKILDIALKDMTRSFRSMFALIFMFGIPLLMTGMFYFMFGGAPRATRVSASRSPRWSSPTWIRAAQPSRPAKPSSRAARKPIRWEKSCRQPCKIKTLRPMYLSQHFFVDVVFGSL